MINLSEGDAARIVEIHRYDAYFGLDELIGRICRIVTAPSVASEMDAPGFVTCRVHLHNATRADRLAFLLSGNDEMVFYAVKLEPLKFSKKLASASVNCKLGGKE